jgi:hypothetical protein
VIQWVSFLFGLEVRVCNHMNWIRSGVATYWRVPREYNFSIRWVSRISTMMFRRRCRCALDSRMGSNVAVIWTVSHPTGGDR